MSLDPRSFDSLGLAPELLRAVADSGYTEPTPVQAEAIPLVLAGRDVLAGAQTGTGKTAAFVLPILQILHRTRPETVQAPFGNLRPRGSSGLPIRTLVLTPTRELALQVEESVRTYGARRPVRSTTIYGGVGYENQVRAIRSGPEIVVATPGRLLDHVGQHTIDLTHVEILVLDEADRMLDMGFIRDIRRILAILPPKRQNLLFSATFSDEIRDLAGGLLSDPAYVQIARRNAPIELVRQVILPVDRERKRELLSHLVRSGRIEQALVFTRTKHGANRLAEQLGRDGINAAVIHGNRSQGQRVRALDDFKAGRVPILVATEIAARGLDIDGLPHVVNFELPMVAEDYVHRIGRTGRAGAEGDAVSLVCIDEVPLLREIERLLRKPIPEEIIEGFAPDRTIRPEPIRLRSVGPHPMPARAGSSGGRGRPAGSPAGAGGFAPARRPGVDARPVQAARPVAPPRPGSTLRPGQAVRPAGPHPISLDAHRAERRPTRNGPAPFDGGRPAHAPRPGGPSREQHQPRPVSGTSIGNRPMAPARRPQPGRPSGAAPGRPNPGQLRVLPGERLSNAERGEG
jgi:ATP-dependent RNA helicase RhlE